MLLKKIQRKVIEAAPMVLGVVGLSYYLISSDNQSLSIPLAQYSQLSTASERISNANDIRWQDNVEGTAQPSKAYVNSQAVIAPQADLSHGRGEETPTRGNQALTQLITGPQPLVITDTDHPSEEHVDEVRRRAVHGANPRDKVAALLELAAIGGPGLLDSLSEALTDPEPQVRRAAITSAIRAAQNKGDQNGELQRWLTQAGYNDDPRVATLARAEAKLLANKNGQPSPFP